MPTSTKTRVLFVCIHNSARSQMAEALLNHHAGDRYAAESAGIEPGKLNPVVVEALHEIGLDISRNETKSVAALIEGGRCFDYVITVCDQTSAGRCPLLESSARRLHWPFIDPSSFGGSFEEKLVAVRRVREEIRARIEAWIDAQKASTATA
jgi:arsenate reductase (thioredoxin)